MLHTPQDRLNHTIKVTEDLFIWKTQNAIAFRRYHGIANSVVSTLVFVAMLTAVQFNNDFRSVLGEIGKITLYRNLAPEVETVPICLSQFPP